ncbi:MAG: hypothetical protein ABEK75_04420 [Salinibacter sp.]
MADYPTPSEYQEALQTPTAAFADPELRDATPRTNVLGLPQPITGAFAAVFPVTTETGGRYALKCFLADVPDQRARYEAVADVLDAAAHDAFVEFGYQPEGVRVGGEAYPLLKMEWAEGTTLNRFVEAHLDEPEVLERLAEAWADLMADLEAMDLAHGDLQHGNVLVDTTPDALRLRLVDYDTMYVPALEGRTSAEVGHRNYQHPDRTDADFGPTLDRFAGLVIYTALRACAMRPELWDRFDKGENLLFRDADFYAPEESPLFDALLEAEPLSDLADALRTACYVEPGDVPSLAAVREGRPDLRRTVSRAASRAGRDADERDAFARAFLPGTIGAGGAAGVLAVAGWPFGALALALAATAVAGGLVGTRYRRLSHVRRRRRLEQEAERFTAAIRDLEREVESLQQKREELRTSMAARREERLREVQATALHDRLKHHFIGEVREVDGLTHKHVVRLKAAGIRTASELTPDAIESVPRISDRARARLKMWRAALEEKYGDEVPDALSPAQERRLQRYVEHRIEDLEAQLARTREKIETQRTERARVEDRLDDMPSLSVGRYVRYLLRLDTLPDRADGPPAPTREEEEARDARTPVPDPADDEGDWWEAG